MTDYQYQILLELNKQLFNGQLDKSQVENYHLQAILEKDRLSVLNLPTSDIDSYIKELELLTQKL